MTQIEALLGFLGEAVMPFHAVAAMSRRLREAGFEEVGAHTDSPCPKLKPISRLEKVAATASKAAAPPRGA